MLLAIEARAPFMMLTNTLTAEPAPPPCNLMKIALFSPFADEKTEAQKKDFAEKQNKKNRAVGVAK